MIESRPADLKQLSRFGLTREVGTDLVRELMDSVGVSVQKYLVKHWLDQKIVMEMGTGQISIIEVEIRDVGRFITKGTEIMIKDLENINRIQIR